MKQFVSKTIKYYISKNKFLIIVQILLLSLLLIVGSFLFFDKNRIINFYGDYNNIPSWDKYILEGIGIEGIAIQGYVFLYVFLALMIIIIFFLDAFFSYRRDKDIICLLKVKGFKFIYSNGLFLIIKILTFLVSSLISIGLFAIIGVAFNNLINVQMPLLILNSPIVIEVVMVNVIYILINLPFYILLYSNERIISSIRNFN